jgi:flagellar assembly protein FliH
MRSFSRRIIFAEDLPDASPWAPEHFNQHVSVPSEPSPPEEPPAPSYEDGFRDGQRIGQEQARIEHHQQRAHELARIGQRIDLLTTAYTEQLGRLQEQLAQQVIALAIAVAHTTIGSALRMQPELIKPAVQSALDALIDQTQPACIRLHPSDLAIVQDVLNPLMAQRPITLVADPSVAAGGCLVTTPHTDVDARIETRWQQALDALGVADIWMTPKP